MDRGLFPAPWARVPRDTLCQGFYGSALFSIPALGHDKIDPRPTPICVERNPDAAPSSSSAGALDARNVVAARRRSD